MIGPLFNLGAGAAQAGYGLYQENQAKKKLAQADAMASGPIRSQAARNRIARQESDSQSAIDSALRSQATQALQISNTGGSRALQAATPGLLRATEMTTGRALDRLGSLGARTGRLEDKINLQTSNAGVVDNRNRLNQAADAARTATLGGVSSMIGGLAGIAGSIGERSKGTKDTPVEDVISVQEKEEFVGNAGSPMLDPLQAMLNQTKRNPSQSTGGFKNIPSKGFNMVEDEFAAKLAAEEEFEKELTSGSPMGSEGFNGFEHGGEVEKTPGEFDHEENPIDIVQEGDKIGEMTGGEYIFNPEQAEELLQLSVKGDTKLHRFIRNLLSKEQFK
tara:strand:- start:3650 stop:4651 length:1002 start_codon:yes stop_codon:yes gene_type:complete